MRLPGLAALALLALDAPAPIAAQDTEIVVRGDLARKEIQRILDADNLDTSRLGAAEVAEAIGGIARGGAPDDFWTAYQAHVAAWDRLAGAQGSLETALAEQAIEATFDEVERVARAYGASMPMPPWQVAPTI